MKSKPNLLKICAVVFVVVFLLYISQREKTVDTQIKFLPETRYVEQKSSISFYPETILPGDPVFMTIHSTSTPEKVFFDDKEMSFFMYKGLPRVLVAVDFDEKNLNHQVRVVFDNGEIITMPLIVTPRTKIEKPVGIPEKLGGNTPQASKTLVSNLAKENAEIQAVSTSKTSLWTRPFLFPVSNVVVTDIYGYDRRTVDRVVIHKGTDFRAATGTPVYAMNDGRVVLVKTYTIYGNMVIIDHGLGLQTLYMHLSKINVKEGDMVTAGDEIGLSGMTGYVTAPHLHVSVKVDGVSIDPMTFLGFFAQ